MPCKTIFFSLLQIKHQAIHEMAINIVIADGHFNPPKGFMWPLTSMLFEVVPVIVLSVFKKKFTLDFGHFQS